MLWQDRGASTPRSHRHKAERCRRLRPAGRAVADASQSDRPRWQLAALSACAAAAGSETLFRNALDSCERPMHTPSRASISARMRAIVRFGRLVTGSSSNGVTTRKVVSLFTGGVPGATLAFNASVPDLAKSRRHSRTVSSRPPNASAMRGLLQPDRVSRMARALSASPRSSSRSLKPGTFHSCRALPKRCRSRIVHLSVGQAGGVCLASTHAQRY